MIAIRIGIIPPGGNIPGRRRPQKKTNRSTGFKMKGKPVYKKMSTRKLEELLGYAEKLYAEMEQVVQLTPLDRNIEKLDKLELTIKQLRKQIQVRKERGRGKR